MTDTFTVDAFVRGAHAVRDAFRKEHHREWTGPVYLTESQAEQLLYASGQQKPDDWDDLVRARLAGSTVLGLPVLLADTVEESTPCTEGWISR